MTRKSWDQYFLEIAFKTASRSTCKKRSVGCVIVKDNIVVSGGYNGSGRGAPHCLDEGCLLDGLGKCVRTVHAEANAVAQAARIGARLEGATAYVTCKPCVPCFLLLANAGILEIKYHEQTTLDLNPFRWVGGPQLLNVFCDEELWRLNQRLERIPSVED